MASTSALQASVFSSSGRLVRVGSGMPSLRLYCARSQARDVLSNARRLQSSATCSSAVSRSNLTFGLAIRRVDEDAKPLLRRRPFSTASRWQDEAKRRGAAEQAGEEDGSRNNGKDAASAGSTASVQASNERFIRTPQFPPPSFPKSFGANQVVPLEQEVQQRFDKIFAAFPQPIRFAFAYGSGVFAQSEAGPEHSKRPETRDGKKMVDIVMAVTHPEHWHGINMQLNKKHYSIFTRLMGGFFLGYIQRLGAGLWYHPYIQIGDELVKYGVMDIDTLCADLLDWDTLYVSGRMHKPVALGTTDARVRLAQQVNLASALRTSLLLLPENFTEVELYTRIASLSYTGDFRMSMPGGENANKVRNIVLGQRDIFRRLYSGLLRSLETVQVEEARENRFQMTQDCSDKTRADYAAKLPLRLREKLQAHYTSHPDLDPSFMQLSMSSKSENIARKPGAKAASLDPELMHSFWRAVVKQPDFKTVLLSKIGEIVRGPARVQSLKGIYTAGFRRTLRYVLAKVGKYFEGRKQK